MRVILIIIIFINFSINALCQVGRRDLIEKETNSDIFIEDHSINLLIYSYEKKKDYLFNRLLPLYSYEKRSNRLYENFLCWPIVAGYEISKNPSPMSFPYSNNFQAYSLALLSLEGSRIDPGRQLESSTFISFLFMTFIQENHLKNYYLNNRWFSLPILSYYNRENLFFSGGYINSISVGNPIFSYEDVNISKDNYIYPVYNWEFAPFSFIMGEEGIKILSHKRWGKDRKFSILDFNGFSLFLFSTTFDSYPGAKYEKFKTYELDTKKGLNELFDKSKYIFPTTRIGILTPFILFESSIDEKFTWQILPLFHYTYDKKDSDFYLIILGLNFKSEGVIFDPQPKLFPLFYYDKTYGSLDILWPLMRYENNPNIPLQKFNFMLLFNYSKKRDSKEFLHVEINALEGMLFSYNSNSQSKYIEILPVGLLFKYYQDFDEYTWSFLGCGYKETKTKEYLQLFFVSIPINNK